MNPLVAMIAMVALAAIAMAAILTVAYALARKRKPGPNAGSVAGNALVQVHTLLTPSAQNITQARKQRREDSGQGNDDPPQLPPRARSNR
jgi:hypothetical protein